MLVSINVFFLISLIGLYFKSKFRQLTERLMAGLSAAAVHVVRAVRVAALYRSQPASNSDRGSAFSMCPETSCPT